MYFSPEENSEVSAAERVINGAAVTLRGIGKAFGDRQVLPAQGPLRADRLREGLRARPAGRRRHLRELRGIDRERGAMVVVRPDQSVANVLPLDAHRELAGYFAGFMLDPA